MKKIVFLIGSLHNGGAERVISVLANEFVKKYEVHILTIMEDKVDYDLDSNINYKYIMKDDEGKKGIIRNYIRIKKIRDFVKKTNPDVVISFLWATNIIAILSCLFLPQCLILSERNDPKHEPGSGILRLIRNCLFRIRKKNYFVFQTEYAQSCFSNYIKRKSKIIFNPIKDNLPEKYTDVRKNKIVCVARLVSEKNISMLLKAFKKVYEKYPDYLLFLYGRGPLEKQLKEESLNLGIRDNVIFKGFSKNVHSEIIDAKLFVLPSNFEGISNAMIEALALGIPTICTDCPAYGAREFITDGENGYLIDVNDEKALEDKMLSVITNVSLQNKFSQNATKIRNNLNSNQICKQWECFIREIIIKD